MIMIRPLMGQKSAGVKARAFFLGVLCSLAQLAIFRELMSSLYGNELSFAGLMAGWSLGIALGSFFGLRKTDSHFLFVIGIVVLFLTVASIRYLRVWLGVPSGQVLDASIIVIVSFVVTLPLCFVCGALFSLIARDDRTGIVYGMESLGFAAGGLAAWLFLVSPLNVITLNVRAPQWPGYTLAAAVETGYASLVVAGRGGEKSLFENGIHVATTGDVLVAEENAHYVLLAHPAPKKILVIGSSASGIIEEALKHPGLTVDCVERDAGTLALIKAHFIQAAKSFDDRRVRILLGDGRQIIRGRKKSYDVIIVAVGDPVSLLANRYYTSGFFHEARAALNPGGILSVSLSASENYVNDQGRQALAVVYHTLAGVFSDVKVIPGSRYLFLAAPLKNIILLDPGLLTSRLNARDIHVKYVRPYEIAFRFEPGRLRLADDIPAMQSGINRDLRPFGFLSALAYVSTQTGPFFSLTAEKVRQYSFCLWLLPIGMVIFARSRRVLPLMSVSAAGFSQISLQIGTIVLFQSIYGSVYSAMGILTALFMSGIFVGSCFPACSIVLIQRYAAMLMLVSAAGVWFASQQGDLWGGLFLVIVPLMAGWCGGRQFSSALHLAPQRGGWLYAADVLATGVGALLVGIFLIPLWGVPLVFLFCAVLQLSLALPISAKAESVSHYPARLSDER